MGSKDKKQALWVYAIYKGGDVLRKKPTKNKIIEAPQLKYKSTKIEKESTTKQLSITFRLHLQIPVKNTF